MPVKLNLEPQDPSLGLDLVPTPLSQVKAMVKNYRQNSPADETTSAWVSVKEIQALISDNHANGIRIYYGRHDASGIYPNMHNVILVATIDSNNPLNPTPEYSADQLSDVNTATFAQAGDDAIPLCPPRCPLPGIQHL
jgi:hypothetical protein